MSQLIAYVKSFGRNEEGQDLLEYALLVALIALIAIGAVGAAGGAANSIFTAIASALSTAASHRHEPRTRQLARPDGVHIEGNQMSQLIAYVKSFGRNEE